MGFNVTWLAVGYLFYGMVRLRSWGPTTFLWDIGTSGTYFLSYRNYLEIENMIFVIVKRALVAYKFHA